MAPVVMTNIYLRQNLVCMENDMFADIFFWLDNKCELSNSEQFDFQKLQFSKSYQETIYSFPGKPVFFFMNFGMDSELSVHILKSYTLLDLIRDIGGFYSSMMFLFSFAGFYCSSQLYKASFINANFIRKSD